MELASVRGSLASLQRAGRPRPPERLRRPRFPADRSSDGTGRILDELARGSERLASIHLTHLPPGWLGKTNPFAPPPSGPVASGSSSPTPTPGSTRESSGARSSAVARDLDLLSLVPRNETRSFLMESSMTLWVLSLIVGTGIWAHGRKRQSLASSGAGAFILARRSAYERARRARGDPTRRGR